jgi:hypothetical protein
MWRFICVCFIYNLFESKFDKLVFSLPEKESIAECRKNWWKDKNCMQMLAALPRRYTIERTLLEGLIKFGESNYANAFQMVWKSRLTQTFRGGMEWCTYTNI